MNELKLFPIHIQKNLDDIADTIGYANIIIGNSISGLYGAVVGFSSIFMLVPNIVMSPTITFDCWVRWRLSRLWHLRDDIAFFKEVPRVFSSCTSIIFIEVDPEGLSNALSKYLTFRNVLTFYVDARNDCCCKI